MEKKATFSQRLEELRKERGLSQTDLAAAINISRQSIGFYEKGERLPDVYVITLICQYFNVTSDYLIGKANARAPDNVDVNEKTGLSDKAINKLANDYKEKDYINILNLLLENDEFDRIIELISIYCFSDRVENNELNHNLDSENEFIEFSITKCFIDMLKDLKVISIALNLSTNDKSSVLNNTDFVKRYLESEIIIKHKSTYKNDFRVSLMSNTLYKQLKKINEVEKYNNDPNKPHFFIEKK